jgi:hypothetical protein
MEQRKTVTVKIMWCANYFDDAADEEPVRPIYIDAATEAEAATKAIAQMGRSTGITLLRATPLSNPPTCYRASRSLN